MNTEGNRFKSVLLCLIHRQSFIYTMVVTVFLSLFCIVRILIPNHIYTFEGTERYFVGKEDNTNIPVFENISLSPGVYRIQLDYTIDMDSQSICLVEDAHVYPGALLVNFDFLYSKLSSTDYTMWLFENTDSLTVSVKLEAGNTLMTGNLTIVETNGLWTALLTIILFCSACITGGILFSVYQKLYGVSVRAKNVFFCIMMIVLLSSTPLLLDGLNLGADLTYHFHRIEAVSAGLASGQFPTRIAPRWLYGQGYADPVFYCNLFLIFPALLRLLGFPLTASYQIFALGVNILTAWIAYYSFSRIFKDYKTGICCSALYTFSIFRIYKFYVTGALGEGTAQIFLPLILLGLYEAFSVSKQEKPVSNAWLHIALGYAGLFQTHVLTSEITILVTLFFCIVYIRKIWNKAVFFTLLKGAVGAVLLSLWYLVPFADYYLTQDVHIKHVSARTIQDRGLYLGQLLYLFEKLPRNAPVFSDGMANTWPAGCGMILAVGLIFFLILWYSKKVEKKSPVALFTKICAVFAIVLLVFSLQIFPWDRLQVLSPVTASLISSLQFPNRFLGWGTCLLIVIMGYCISNRQLYFGKFGNYLAFGTMMLAAVSACYLLEDTNIGMPLFKVYDEGGMNYGYISGAEYLIQGTDETLLTFDKPSTSDTVSISSYTNEMLHITAHCTNSGDQQGYVDMPLLLYKGYQAWHTDSGEPLEITNNSNNQVRVLLPASFSGNIEIKFVSPAYWRAAEIISLIMLICLMVMFLHKRLNGIWGLPAYGRKQHERKD